MKALLLITALWCAAAVAGEPQRVLPSGKPHQTPNGLTYRYMVAAPKGLKHKARKLVKHITPLDGIQAVWSLDSLPDVVFVLDNNSPEAEQITVQAEKRNAYVVSFAPRSHANTDRINRLLQSRYFSGQRPTYSTVFTSGVDYHNYRIPSVVTTKNGTVIAFAEGRAFARRQAENDIVMRRSTNGGKSWEPMIVIDHQGKSSLNNPTAVYLADKNRIILLYQKYPPQMNENNAVADAVRCYMVTSDNLGVTWSTPRDITAWVAPAGATSISTGPGVGIVLERGVHKGRIVVPCNVNTPVWYNYLLYSDDQGATWHIDKQHSAYGLKESQVVEVGNDSLLVVARCHRYVGDSSHTAPKGWTPWNYERVTRRRAQVRVVDGKWGAVEIRQELVDPTCQGSVVRVDNLLLLSNPASDYTALDDRPYRSTPPARINGSVRYSRDGGVTWTPAKRIYGDRLTEFQYSVLTPMGDGKIGCLFEANSRIKFAVFDLKWLMH